MRPEERRCRGAPTRLRLIGQAYDCEIESERAGALLDACARFAGGDTAVVYVKPRASAAGSLLTSRDFDLSYNVSRYLSYYEQRSPLIQALACRRASAEKQIGSASRAAPDNPLQPDLAGVLEDRQAVGVLQVLVQPHTWPTLQSPEIRQ